MTSFGKNVTVFGIAFLLFALPTAYYLQQHGVDEGSLGVILRISARLALLIYLLVFIARPLRDLSVNPLSRNLLRNRRLIGIAFAAIMMAHLILLIARNGFPADIFGMIVYLFIVLMLITSFNKPTAALGPKRWKLLHRTGLYVIGIALAQAQFRRVLQGQDNPVHLILSALILIAIGIRVAAWIKHRKQVVATQDRALNRD
jgi:sulfoxide reductase heme-binding subunit YedZ